MPYAAEEFRAVQHEIAVMDLWKRIDDSFASLCDGEVVLAPSDRPIRPEKAALCADHLLDRILTPMMGEEGEQLFDYRNKGASRFDLKRHDVGPVLPPGINGRPVPVF